MSGALDGIRVLDLTTRMAEATGKAMADLGAEVIKVESVLGCDARTTPPFAADGRSLFWEAWGLGKHSVVCDVELPGARDQFRALVAGADVLLESFAPGYMDGLGLGPDDLAAVNPALVYVSVTPFGAGTPDAAAPMTDLTLSAAGGLLAMQGDHDRVPIPVGYPETSFLGAMQAAADAIMALCERDRSGLGQHLDSSIQAAVLWSLMSITSYAALGQDFPGRGDDRADVTHPEVVPGVPMPVIEPCADGYVGMTLVLGEQGNRGMKSLMAWVVEEGALDDDLAEVDWEKWLERLGDGSLSAEDAARALQQMLDFIKTKTQAEIQQRAVAGKMLVAPCYTSAYLAADPQLAARDFWVEVDGAVHAGPFARLSATPIAYRHPAPSLGQHQQILEGLKPVRAPEAPSRVWAAPRGDLFEGLKVADLSWIAAGPLISKDLANLGATVVRVETEARLDTLRWIPPHLPHSSPMSAGHPMANMNQSKLGLGLNFTVPEAKAVIDRMIEWADVVVENYTPGTAERLGFGYKQVSALNPRAVMLSTCMRGQTGPEARHTGFGLHGACLGGFAAITGWPDRAPNVPWGAYTDFISPRYALSALGAALHHRHRTGEGQYIDLSQIEASIHFLAPLVLEYRDSGRVRAQAGLDSERASPHGVYRTQGVERFCAIAVETDEQWEALGSVVADMDMVEDRFSPIGEANADELLIGWFLEHDNFEAAQKLRDAGVPAYAALRASDFCSDPNLVAREFFIELDHGAIGKMTFDGPVTVFSATPARPWRAGPLVGEHTQQVMSEILGFSDDEISALAATGALT
ncbi:CaiB/BaiF CoA transferase family protein [Candidatus Poriferisocius sp.]|uniref:CaiB/BaiF CoA transferase family protein n=1 Tax=Candidatus Poriferisocius sp. TaxID=3101276 RepID=UPI003B027743